MLRRHRLFAVLWSAGLALRVATFLAYRPALLYIDSYPYLENMGPLNPVGVRPIGYSVVLRPLTALGDLRIIPLLQHTAGLAMAVGIYVLLLRAGARRWLAALAAAPVMLDAYQLQIEQSLMSEPLFQALVLGGLVLTVDGLGPRGARTADHAPARREAPDAQSGVGRRLTTAALAGLLLGLAVVVRLIGQFLVVPGAVYLLFEAGRRWRTRIPAAAVFVAAFALPVVSYMAYYATLTGAYGLSPVSGRLLYGRAAVVVDCDRIDVPTQLRDLCPQEPPDARPGVDHYLWSFASPLRDHDPPPGTTLDESLRQFGRLVVRQQPLDLARAVVTDMAKTFYPTKAQFPRDVAVERWHFRLAYPDFDDAPGVLAQYGATPQVQPGLATFLRGYQLSIGYTPGTLLGVAIVLGLLGGLGVGRTRDRRLRAACLLWTVAGAGLVLLPSVWQFSWRYMLPALVTLPVAGALGLTALTGRDDVTAAPHGPPGADPGGDDAIDTAAATRFADTYGAPRLAPVAVVIAAYNEEGALGDVLQAVPAAIDDAGVSVVVVDDGSTDATVEVARSGGAFVVEPGVNRGQGAALRLGYRTAREGGARVIATLDADGQYDPAELPDVVRPVLRDEADFVTGSRRLGREETTDAVRRAGVRFYAWLVSALTRQRITDTSFGMRAMRADVTATVTLRQPQYQSSELLIGALAHGYRVLEVAGTMRQRGAGASKKGHNVLYGARYGRVVVGTWLRERSRRRGRAPRSGAGDPGTGGRTART